MSDPEGKKPFQSTGANKTMRSRGFLSQPGGAVSSSSGKDGSPEAPTHHKSRGSRKVSISSDGAPKALSPKARAKPYRLDEE